MASLTIRNLDTQVVESLKERAKANHRSLEGEVRLLLERHGRQLSQDELIAQAEEIAAMSPPRPGHDSAQLLQEDRNR